MRGALAAIVAWLVPAVAAATGLEVEVRDGSPCTATELRDALALRVEDGAAGRVQVEPGREGMVRLAVDGEEREVAVGTRRGEPAAREIAMAVADSLLESDIPYGAHSSAAPAPLGDNPWLLGAGLVVGIARSAHAGVTLDLEMPLGERFAATLGESLLAGGDGLFTTRLGVAARLAPATLRTGGLVQLVSGCSGTRARAGAWAGASFGLRVGPQVALTATAGADWLADDDTRGCASDERVGNVIGWLALGAAWMTP